jgi:hypothetical protein
MVAAAIAAPPALAALPVSGIAIARRQLPLRLHVAAVDLNHEAMRDIGALGPGETASQVDVGAALYRVKELRHAHRVSLRRVAPLWGTRKRDTGHEKEAFRRREPKPWQKGCDLIVTRHRSQCLQYFETRKCVKNWWY